MKKIVIHGVDVSHSRLEDLAKLADQAEPFYEWVETQFRSLFDRDLSLHEYLKSLDRPDLERGILHCYRQTANLPMLFDGIGRSYSHSKACYYFFSWTIRDAPQQRLEPLITKVYRNSPGRDRCSIEAQVISELIVTYRKIVSTFEWPVIREIVLDRLEGSRRSIKGHQKEAVVRTALLTSLQRYFDAHDGYGLFTKVEIPPTQVTVGNETFDVSANLIKNGTVKNRILMPIKTRETEGGGHSHLFTRDISSAINAIREAGTPDFLAVVIVAGNWSERETENIRSKVHHLSVFGISPNDFDEFSDDKQQSLDTFVKNVLNGQVTAGLA